MMNEHTAGYVKSSANGSITTIEFFHPQSNSLPGAILRKLADEITHAGNDENCNVILLKSAGEKSFCAGASFDELLQIKNETEGLQFFSGFSLVINAMRKARPLIIARIQGKCVGGGVGLAAAADYAIATKAADVKLSELAVGIGPFVVGPAVERKMGVSAFSTLAINASNWRSSEWAHQNGLFAELHDTASELDEAINTLSNTLAASSPEAMAAIKKIIWKGTDDWDKLLIERAGISGRLILGSFSKNAIEKFKKK